MSNVKIEVTLVNNNLWTLIDTNDNCVDAVKIIAGDDTGAPVRHIRIIVKTESGKLVKVVIPNDSKSDAIVMIDDEKI